MGVFDTRAPTRMSRAVSSHYRTTRIRIRIRTPMMILLLLLLLLSVTVVSLPARKGMESLAIAVELDGFSSSVDPTVTTTATTTTTTTTTAVVFSAQAIPRLDTTSTSTSTRAHGLLQNKPPTPTPYQPQPQHHPQWEGEDQKDAIPMPTPTPVPILIRTTSASEQELSAPSLATATATATATETETETASTTESSSSSSSSSSTLSSPYTSSSNGLSFFETVMEAYRETVDTIVSYQTRMWHYVPRYRSFDPRNVDGMCDSIRNAHLTSSIPRFERERERLAASVSASASASPRDASTSARTSSTTRTSASASASATTTTTTTTTSIGDDWEHDTDSDIDGYLRHLATVCSRPIRSHNFYLAAFDRHVFQTECLDELESLVYDPLCTTLSDSRIPCDGRGDGNGNGDGDSNGDGDGNDGSTNSTTASVPKMSPGALIAEHFGGEEDALHVLILGAGPVGLMLANALSMLTTRNRHDNSHDHDHDNHDNHDNRKNTTTAIPPIRIVVVDTRADAPGRKRPYTRNWQAHLDVLHFRHHDPRLQAIFAAMKRNREGEREDEREGEDESESGESDGNFVLPLNAIETLLLLSTKDLGATKFLFGVNPLDLAEDLQKVPNLVMVDATGHRLEPLARGTVCDGDRDDHGDCEGECAAAEPAASASAANAPTRTSRYRSPDPPSAFASLILREEKHRVVYETLKTFRVNFTDEESIGFLEERGHDLVVEQSGDLLYPVKVVHNNNNNDDEEIIPASVYWLDVHGASYSRHELMEELEEDVADALFANNDSPFCEWCFRWYDGDYEKTNKEPGDEDKASIGDGIGIGIGIDSGEHSTRSVEMRCAEMCYTNYYSQSMTLLRRDLQVQILKGKLRDTFVSNHEDDDDDEDEEEDGDDDYYYGRNAYYGDDDDEEEEPGRPSGTRGGWFPIGGYSFNPSPALAHELEGVLADHGYRRDPVGMPLRDLYPALQRRCTDRLQRGEEEGNGLSVSDRAVITALGVVANHSASESSDWPTVTLFVQSPFIYTNGVKEKTKSKTKPTMHEPGSSSSSPTLTLNDVVEHAPMIRVGDSFTVGDGIQGGGLYTHATMIGLFMDVILDRAARSSLESWVIPVH